jgi:hypothetical protein
MHPYLASRNPYGAIRYAIDALQIAAYRVECYFTYILALDADKSDRHLVVAFSTPPKNDNRVLIFKTPCILNTVNFHMLYKYILGMKI